MLAAAFLIAGSQFRLRFCSRHPKFLPVAEAWSVHVFNWRADGLDYKVDMRYEDQVLCLLDALRRLLCRRQDNIGPVVLVVSIMAALVFSTAHAVRNSELMERLPSCFAKVCEMRPARGMMESDWSLADEWVCVCLYDLYVCTHVCNYVRSSLVSNL